MRSLTQEDDPILRKRGLPFDFDNPQEDPEKLAEELLDAMVKYEGMGISACQIGVDLKVFAMRFNGDGIVAFNPRITNKTKETTYINSSSDDVPGKSNEEINIESDNASNIKQKTKRNYNYFNIFLVTIISITAIILILDTFKESLEIIFPNIKFLLNNLYQTIEDIKLFIFDLIK